MITPSGAWTMPMCRAAAAPIATAHQLELDVYLEGSSRGSALRFDLHRGLDVICWLALDVRLLEACADEAAVRDLVEREVTAVVRMRCGAGAAA